MEKKPELEHYGLDQNKVSVVSGINNAISEKLRSQNRIIFVLILILFIFIIIATSDYFKKYNLFLIIGDLLVCFLVSVFLSSTSFYESGIKDEWLRQFSIYKVTKLTYEDWKSKYRQYEEDLRKYEIASNRNNTSYNYPNYKRTTKYKTSTKVKTSADNSNKSVSKIDNAWNDNKEANFIKEPVNNTEEIKKPDPESILIQPFGSNFKRHAVLQNKVSDHKSNEALISGVIRDVLDENSRHLIGESGELFILEYEKRKLMKYKLWNLISKVEHTSKIQGNHIGYDITSFNSRGDKIFIEVKTTTQGISTPFLMSSNEFNTRKTHHNYFIYRLFDFDLESKNGKLYVINPGEDIETFFRIEPTEYKFTPNLK